MLVKKSIKMYQKFLMLIAFNFNFAIGLPAWEANLNLHPGFDYYKAATFMWSYWSKQEDKCS